MKRLLVVISLIVVMGSSVGFTQVDPSAEQGLHAFGSYDVSKVDNVNLQNGAVSFKIPLFSYPERGKFGTTVELVMSSKQWTVNETCDQFTGTCGGTWYINPIPISNTERSIYPNLTGAGVVIDDGVPTLGSVLTLKELPNGVYRQEASWVAVDADGSTHSILGGTDGSTTGSTVDASGIVLNTSANVTMVSRNGVSSNGSSIEDTNGNIEQNTTGQDSIGRAGLYAAFNNAQTITDSSGCSGPLPSGGWSAGQVKLVTFPGPNGSTRQLKLCSVEVAGKSYFDTTFNDPGNPGDEQPIAEGTYGGLVLQSAVLYNETNWTTSPAWTFQYSSPETVGGVTGVNYVDLTQITFPTGGTISYSWINGTISPGCGFTNVSRMITQRVANANDGSPEQISSYNITPQQPIVVTNYNGTTEESYVQHYFAPAVPNTFACNQYEAKTVYHDVSSGDKILKTVQTSYTGMQYPFYTETLTYLDVNVLPSSVTTTLANGMVSQVQTDYDSSLAVTYYDPNWPTESGYGELLEVGGLSRGLLKQKREYAYGNGAPGPLVRCTTYDYEALDNSAYMNANNLDLPSSVKVYAGACGTGTLMSQTTNTYDGTTLQSSGVNTQFDTSIPNPGIRGNLTSVQKWLNTGGSVTTSTKYYDTGMPYQSTDGNENTTTYTYSLAYAGGLLTQTQMPNTGTVQHTVSAGYDFNTGLLTSYTDQNSNSTTFAYDDLSRMTTVTFPDTGVTALSYPNFNTVTETVLDGTTTTTEFDGLGRKSHVILSDPEGNDTTDYTYDWAGRLASVSNPYRSTNDPTYGITQYMYDALNRKTSRIQQDGSTEQWSYDGAGTTGSAVLYTDEIGNQWQRTSDAFGRLTEVLEPNSWETDYTYDALNDLTRVDQWGGPSGSSGDRVRTFIYDSLGHLTSATNPESGTTSYSYDNNGNMLTKTDARSLTTSYGYDALNRLVQKLASGISYQYYYDQTGHGASIGRITHISNDINAASDPTYDSMGRVTKEIYCIPSDCSYSTTVQAGYDLAGNLTSLTYPDGRALTESYDAAQHLTGINYANWNGTSVNYNYLASATYAPDGSPQSLSYGNGAIEAITWNNRLQFTEAAVQTDVGGSLQTVFDKRYCYGPTDTRLCPAISADNGNILRVLDMFSNSYSQGFSYDNLNRLIAFNTGDNSMVQSFGYDQWGNLEQVGTEAFQTAYGTNNRIEASGFIYDAAGELTQTDFGVPQTYAYDAEGKITSYNNGAATYTYDADGERVRKDSAGSWTEYVYFNGVPLAEKNSDGSWSDYIYGNGQRMARADSYDERIHISGTSTVAGSYAEWSLPFASYVIKSGDKISWRQYQTAAEGGIGIGFTDNTYANWIAKDTDGQLINSDTTEGVWHDRTVDLSAFAGKTVAGLGVVADAATSVGSWNIYYGDIAIYSADGTVTTIYERAPSTSFSYSSNGGETNPQAAVERSNQAGDAEQPANTTTYYVADRIESSRMLLTGGGWPVSQDTYYPFGAEPYPASDQNHYKFSGKERDAESGNDNFGARYYSSAMGRFLSPDYSDAPQAMPYADLGNPQSFNRYAYVNNNPLGNIDADGHLSASGGPCGNEAGAPLPITHGDGNIQTSQPCVQPAAAGNKDKSGRPDHSLLSDVESAGKSIGRAISTGSDYLNDHPLLAIGLTLGSSPEAWEAEAPAIENATDGALAGAESTLESAGDEVANLAGKAVYRVWGGESGPYGASWTTADPTTIPNYRDAAGLPDQNTGQFLSEGIIQETGGVISRTSLQLHGNGGGLPEIVVPNPQTQILLKNIQGLNPQF